MFEKWIGRHVVVRTYSAGVHIGVLAEVEAIAAAQGLVSPGCHADLGGVPRALVLSWAPQASAR